MCTVPGNPGPYQEALSRRLASRLLEAVYRVDVIPQAAGRFVYTSATARGRFNEREIKLKAARPGGDPSEGCMDRADV